MIRTILTLSAFGLLTGVMANASSLSPGGSVAGAPITINTSDTVGGFGGTLIIGASSANYQMHVYSDPTNPFCTGCLDFVYFIDDQSNSTMADFTVSNFGGNPVDVGYFSTNFGNVVPQTISFDTSGNITFDFGSALAAHDVTENLVVVTSAATFANGSVEGIDANGATGFGTAFEPTPVITTTGPVPEPSTLLLFGSGVVGLAGAAKRRFLA